MISAFPAILTSLTTLENVEFVLSFCSKKAKKPKGGAQKPSILLAL